MKKVLVLIVGATVLASARTAIAVPVVPNFTQGRVNPCGFEFGNFTIIIKSWIASLPLV